MYSVAKVQEGKASAAARGVESASGGGVQENVDNTVELILALNLASQKPDAINMIGWSRGAVTCIRIAWKLYQSQDGNIRDIPINIFAVDPVAGAGHHDYPRLSTHLDGRRRPRRPVESPRDQPFGQFPQFVQYPAISVPCSTCETV